MANQTTYDIFLSHHSADKPAVEELARRLVEAGLTLWLDTWTPGTWSPASPGKRPSKMR